MSDKKTTPVKQAPARRPGLATFIHMVEPSPEPMTYGSWMELGLAARQLMASARQGEAMPKRVARRR